MNTHNHKLSLLLVLKGMEQKLNFFPNENEREEKREGKKKSINYLYQHTWKILFSPTRIYSVELPPPSHWPPSSIVRSRNAKGRHFYRHKDAAINICIRFGPFVDFECDCRHHYATFRLTEGVLAPLSTGGVNRPENTYTWRGLIPVVGRRRGGTILPIFSTMKKIFALFLHLLPFRLILLEE